MKIESMFGPTEYPEFGSYNPMPKMLDAVKNLEAEYCGLFIHGFRGHVYEFLAYGTLEYDYRFDLGEAIRCAKGRYPVWQRSLDLPQECLLELMECENVSQEVRDEAIRRYEVHKDGEK
jgi:hypothetical protein